MTGLSAGRTIRPRVRVVFVNRFFYPDISATSQILSDLAFALAQDGLEVHVITSRLSYLGLAPTLAPAECVQGVEVHRVWTTRFGRGNHLGRMLDYLTFYLASFFAILALARRGDVLVAKTDPPLISVVVALAASLRRATLINWIQDLFPDVASQLKVPGLGGWGAALLRHLRDWGFKRAALNVVIGVKMAQLLERRGIAPKGITLISNWADGSLIKPLMPAENTLRKAWNLGEKFVVGYSGNLGMAHDAEAFLRVAEHLRDDQKIVFLFVGGGGRLDAFRQEVEDRQLTNVRFEPYQPREKLGLSLTVPDLHMVSLLPILEGLIVPSKFYGALAAGRPIAFIGDAQGELAREITGAHCGGVFASSDTLGLATFIANLARNSKDAASMGGRARSLFMEKYEKSGRIDSWKTQLARVGVSHEQ